MSDMTPLKPSPTPSSPLSSIETLSSDSEEREPEWWWHWSSQSLKEPRSADPSEAFILNERRSRKQARRFPEPELYSGEADIDAQKRMRLNVSYRDNSTSTKKKHTALQVELSVSNDETHRASNQKSDNTTKSKRGTCIPEVPIYKGNAPSLETCIKSEKEIQSLKREVGLLGLHDEKRASAFRQDIRYLQEENFALCRKLDWYKTQYEAIASGSCALDGLEELRVEVEKRDVEIDEKVKQISSLEDQLNTAEGLSAILRDSQDQNNASVNFSEDLAQLEAAMGQAALLLVQCLSDKKLSIVRKSPSRTPELSAIIRQSLGKFMVITSYPRPAFSALLFSFTRERVFYSGCWTALHLEGHMLRGYQAVIQRITPSGTLEGLHRAALELMLEEDHPFRESWIQSQVEEVKSEFLCLIDPLFEASKMEIFDKGIQAALNQVFAEAFRFRARCVPPKGTRYELMQVKEGDMFDPEYMVAQGPDGSIRSIPSEKAYRVKLCVHGCLISYVMDDESFDGALCSTISQAFISADGKGRSFENKQKKVLKSEKAIVILDYDTQP
ncbi:hypothetical protein N7478_011156 [Penicillium angulare]|uniref:uncharacterized protein n=1 Tax=Penicillium angulare TaxID=116970 RepID=UPI002541076B|nr:uncharacterized protein N7478_011156 [Penicillium angulare]KAJ5263551.1 hypothetical protein N7478_011156 [Penicillium angulare]